MEPKRKTIPILVAQEVRHLTSVLPSSVMNQSVRAKPSNALPEILI